MTVNSSTYVAIVLLTVLAATMTNGCGGTGQPPHVSYIVASSRLRPDGETRRLDVVVDVRNTNNKEYSNLKLTVTFMDHTEAVFEWPSLPPYGTKGGQAAIELKIPVTKDDMLGGSFEAITDIANVTTQYATEVKGAVLSYKEVGGSKHEKEIGLAVAKCIKDSFAKLSTDEMKRQRQREKRLKRLRKKSKADR